MKRVTLWAVSGFVLALCAIPVWSYTSADQPVGYDHGIPVFQLPPVAINATPGAAVADSRVNEPTLHDAPVASIGQAHLERMHVAER